MQIGSGVRRRTVPRLAATLSVAWLAFAAACSPDGTTSPQSPILPPNPPKNPELTAASFVFDVNMHTGTVKVTAPTKTLAQLGVVGDPTALQSTIGPDFSIIGGDVIEIVSSNFQVTAGGGFQSGGIPQGACPGGSPAAVSGKLCVEFDVSAINELLGVQLVGPQVFPTPPAGSAGPVLFPFDVVVTQTSGGTSTGGPQGNDVIIELPSDGAVEVSPEWAGVPHNFFNDAACAGIGGGSGQGDSDCYRWEELSIGGSPVIPGGAASDPVTIGFYIDPTVGNFRVRLLLGADLQNQSGSAAGTIAGTVTSPQLGALAGVGISVTGGFSGTTGAAGDYSIGGVGVGARTVEIVSGLPAGCTNPGTQGTTVTNGATSTVNFTVTCPVAAGTISGQITSSLGGGLAGVSVIVTPAGGSALSAAVTDGNGDYSKSGVPLGSPSGTGSIDLSGLPAGCTNPGATPYSGLSNGGSITVSITVTCVPPPELYFLNGAWSGSGSTRTYTLSYDLTQRDDPAIPGVDDVFVISGQVQYDNTKLQYASSSNVAGSVLQNQGTAEPLPGIVTWQNFDTDGTQRATGVVGVVNINFTVLGGATGTVTPVTSYGEFDDIMSDTFVDLKPNTVVQDAILTL